MSRLHLTSLVRPIAGTRAVASLALFALAAVAGCSGGSGSPVQGIVTGHTAATPTPSAAPSKTPSPTATPTTSPSSSPTTSAACINTVSQSVAANGAATLMTSATNGSFTETIAAGQITTATTATLGYQPQSSLAAPLARSTRRLANGLRTPMFTAGAGNTYVIAFCASFGGATPTSGVSLSGTGVVPSTVAVGTALNIAILSGGTWVDVGTAQVTATGNFQSTAPTSALPGINQSGTYLVYVPAQGTNTSQINLGFALVGDDSSGYSVGYGLQFLQLEDTSGNALPTPTSTYFPIDATDLDGQSLTPDASRGATVDGGNNVYFFSGIPQHTVTVAANTVNVSNYGGDGDSIASLPNGDEVVVSADYGGPLAVISGILSGNPAVSDTVPIPAATAGGPGAYRDGLAISTDGTVLLSRGATGIDVYKVAATAPHAGSGSGVSGTTSYTFSLTTSFLTSFGPGQTPIAAPYFEDGRDGMAFSPVDASRAVVIGTDSGGSPTVQLLTGLNTTTPTYNSIHLQIPKVAHRVGKRVRLSEPSSHRQPFAFAPPSSDGSLYAVAVSPSGTTAYVSTDAGILILSGVNTGSLNQVGAIYSPTLTVPAPVNTCPLQSAPTIGILPDGKFLVAVVNCGLVNGSTYTTQGTGVLVTIPIQSGGALGAPVGQYNNVVTPQNDQMITH